MTTKTHFVLAAIELRGTRSKQKVEIRFSPPSAEETNEYLSVRVIRREERKRKRRMIKGTYLLCSEREKERKTEWQRKERMKVMALKARKKIRKSLFTSLFLSGFNLLRHCIISLKLCE